jgi:hypothetical protein
MEARQETTLRYLLVLKELKKQIEKNPQTTTWKFFRKKNVNDKLLTHIIKAGIIKNKGGNKYPHWEWVSIEPNIHMVKKLRGEILKESRGYERNKKNTLVNKKPTKITQSQSKFKQEVKKTKTISILWGLIKITKTI